MNIIQQIKSMVWQNNTCAVCNHRQTSALLCQDCQAVLDGLSHCEHCGFFYPNGTIHNCTYPADVTALLTCFPYASVIKRQLFLLKYHNKPLVASRFAPLLAQRWRDFADGTVCVDAIISVPLHSKRRLERGYNQSVLLAKALSKEIHLPVYTDAVRRIANTRPLHSMSAAERRENLKNAFAAGADIDKVRGKNVILLDDIITTGATIDYCAQILHSNGVQSVYALAVAGHLVK